MEESVKQPLLVALAAKVAETFPELGGRCIAVSEVEPFNSKSNVPTLPVAFTALVAEAATQSARGGPIEISSDILLTFIYAPQKYQMEDRRDSPFFAFYDYESIRDRFLEMAVDWASPGGGSISYRSLDVESDEFGVWITLRFNILERWCRPQGQKALELTILSRLAAPSCPETPC